MPVVVPITLILIMLVGIGTEISGLAGMTVSEAFDSIRSNHNYSISEEQFNDIYSEYHDNPLFANQIISKQDLNKILAENVAVQYNIAVQASGDALEYILGGFDSGWVADVSSRTIKVYDSDTGELVGSMEIYCGVNGSFDSNVPPVPVEDGNTLCFRYVTADGLRYSTYLRYASGGVSEASRTLLGYNNDYFSFRFSDKWANNVAFIPASADGTFYLKGVYNGNTYRNDFPLVTGIEGNNDLDTTVPYIGTATTSDGSEVGIRPDGSIVMPDGSVVYPSTTTGLYPDDVTGVRLDDDFWARVAELIGQNTKTGDTSADGALTNLNLEGLRSIASSIFEYIKGGFWADLKDNLVDVFEVDPASFKFADFEKYDITGRFLKWLDSLWFGVTGVHLVQSQGG